MNADSRKGRQRILSLWFPHLPAERILRRRLGPSWRSGLIAWPPLVISHRQNNTQCVAALDERAEALRLKPGMGIADARAMHPSIEVVEADPDADRHLLEGIADWCDRYTPLVALDGADGLFLDITGCAHLFGGERAMLDDLLGRLFHQGFGVCAGLASTPGAAWAAARFDLAPVDAGEEAAALAPLPLAALRIAAKTRDSLESVGLRTVGALLNTPRAPLARRFGKEPLIRLDQAFGGIDEAISPRLPVAALSVERHLAEPVGLMEDIENLIGMLTATLKTDLERRGEGARGLQLALFRVDGVVARASVHASRPLREPASVKRLFHERLAALAENFDAGYGFDLVRLSVLSSAPFVPRQTDLAGETDDDDDIALFADRVRARFGRNAIMKPVVVESHLPERSVAMIPFDEPIAATRPEKPQLALRIPLAERPIRLFSEPEAIEVAAVEVPEGPPLNFHWRRVLHKVARAEGPERIAPEWWLQSALHVEVKEGEDRKELEDRANRARTARLTRDYFRVEDDEGRRYWLYREGLYGVSETPPRWFMHGLFA